MNLLAEEAPARGVVWPFVGRGQLVEELVDELGRDMARGYVFFGEPGVGKTRTAAAVVDGAVRRGNAVARLVGRATTRSLPLATVAPLLPPELVTQVTDPVAAAAAVRTALVADGRPLVVLADDLHHFDTASLVVLDQLTAASAAQIVGTVGAGADVPELVSGAWQRGDWRRIDLAPLPRESLETMLHLGLGAPVAGEVAQLVWERTEGNPLMAQELVAAAVGTGAVRAVHGVWSLTGTLTVPGRLRDLVATRLAALSDSMRDALTMVAICQPVSVHDLEARFPLGDLAELERRGHLVVTTDGRRELVTLPHGLIAEVLSASVPRLEARRWKTEAAAALEATGARRRDDTLRIASWNLDAGRPVDAATLRRAVEVARRAGDLSAAARLVDAWRRQAPDHPTAAVVLAGLLSEQGRFDEVRSALRGVDLSGASALERAVATGVVSVADALVTGDAAQAVRALDAALPVLSPDGPEAGFLRAARAIVLAFDDDPRGLDDLDDDEACRSVWGSIARLHLLSECGRAAEALRFAEQCLQAFEHRGAGRTARIRPYVFDVHLAVGDIVGACHAGDELARGAWHPAPTVRPMMSMIVGRAWLLRGDPVTAERWFRDALASADVRGLARSNHRAAAGLAHCLTLTGRLDEARPFLDHARATRAALRGRRSDLVVAEAALAVASGDPAAARTVLGDAAAEAADRGLVLVEARMRHALFRLEPSGAVAERLEVLAGLADNPLLAVWAGHARGVVRTDPAAVSEAVDAYLARSLGRDAVDALADLADVAARAGDPRAAASARARADALREELTTVGSATRRALDVTVPLSAREREVATLAAARLPSKEIARRLDLSVRTVNNHLQNVYTKLNINSRDELSDHLGGGARDA